MGFADPELVWFFLFLRQYSTVEGKSCTQRVRFFTFTFHLKVSECPAALNLNSFYHQILANFPQNATEIKRHLNYARNLCFLKRRYLFLKSLNFCRKW